MAQKINKSKRLNVSIPRGTEIEAFLINNGKVAHWELLNQLIKQLPKSKEEQVYKSYLEFSTLLNELYPGNTGATAYLWILIAKRLMKVPDADGKEVILKDSFFEELKKL